MKKFLTKKCLPILLALLMVIPYMTVGASAAEDTTVIYVDPSVKPAWESFAVYIYDDSGNTNGAWPGVVLTRKNSEGYYIYKLPSELQGKNNLHVIFNNNAAASGVENEQVEDGSLVISAGQSKLFAPASNKKGWTWKAYTPAPASGTTTVFIDPAIKPAWEEIAVYVYGDDGAENAAWPGVVATETNLEGHLVYKLPEALQGKDDLHVIFNNNPTEANGRQEEKSRTPRLP